MKSDQGRPAEISRRKFVQSCAAGVGALVGRCGAPALVAASGKLLLPPRPATRTILLDEGWLFGGSLKEAALRPEFDDSSFQRVSLPHCVARLSWQKWNPAEWEGEWIYRRRFGLPGLLESQRVFLHFDGVMVGATPVVNGHAFPKHLGGYLPFAYEITPALSAGENVLAVALDSRWSDTPPEGSPRGRGSIDYLEPGGIPRPVSLRVVPGIFISDVFARPVDVLDADRRLELFCSIDAAAPPSDPIGIEAALTEGSRVIARTSRQVTIAKAGKTDVALRIERLANVKLWDVDHPQLYGVEVSLFLHGKPLHRYRTRTGFRDARFEVDGFFLNGRRFRIFGLDRHELFPYTGFAMPARTMRRDAELLRRKFNCNFVRCSHYPQSEAFLQACDEQGLMVWEELPGWQYLGDAAWQERAVRDVQEMVRRDRNHPAVVIWGVRINESRNDPELYRKTKDAADALDGSRPTSGTMTRLSTSGWLQDVFAYDDYHAGGDGGVDIAGPLPGVPYFVTEAVGQFDYAAGKGFNSKYRRAGDVGLQMRQAVLHCQAHDRGAAHPRLGGVVAWCAFDYGSLINSYDGVKCPGIADIFRIPKLGASFYMAQVDPKIRPVIEPDFYWDFGPRTPSGPGKDAAIFSNCERLDLFVDGKRHSTLFPDRTHFPRTKYPPFFSDLTLDGSGKPELRIEGYVGQMRVLSRSFSSDTTKDRLILSADDTELSADGSDATRLEFRAADKFGATRPFVPGRVRFEVDGPGLVVGDNPFELGDNGGAGAIWVRTVRNGVGRIHVAAAHPRLGSSSVDIQARSPRWRRATP